jgi:hypothetical protein
MPIGRGACTWRGGTVHVACRGGLLGQPTFGRADSRMNEWVLPVPWPV